MVELTGHAQRGYGAIPASTRGPSQRRWGGIKQRVAFAASVACMAAIAGIVALGREGRTVLYYHGILDPVTWDGVGAGGTGASYHWTAHSFSPVSGTRDVHFTHDHSSWANHWTEEGGWTPGQHDGSPVRATRPYGWLDRMIEETVGEGEEANATNATMPLPLCNETMLGNGTNGTANCTELEVGEGTKWKGIPLTAYDFFARMFPKQRGYSRNLFGGDDEEEEEDCCNCTNATNATLLHPCGVQEEDGANATNATDMNATNATMDYIGEAEVSAEAEEEQRWMRKGEEEEEAMMHRGVNSPMVFNDLPDIAGYQPVQRGPMFRAGTYAQRLPGWRAVDEQY